MTAPTLRLLLAEDNPDDAALQLRELKRAGLRVTHRVVDSKATFEASLREFAPDVILSDFTMPSFDGMEALRLAMELAYGTPFIFVSGTLGEDYAVRALKNGATDYVLKANLIRLPAAVERALIEAEERRARRRTESELEIARERLKEREAGLARAEHLAKLAHVVTASDGAFKSWSESLPQLVGLDASDMPRSAGEWLDLLVHPDDRERFRAKTMEATGWAQRADIDYRVRHKSGAWIHLRQVIEPMSALPGAGAEKRWFNTLQDVTEHRQAQERIRRLNRVHAVLTSTNSLIVRVNKREDLFEEACRIAVEAGRFRMAWLAIIDRETAVIRPVASHGEVGDFLRQAPLGAQGKRAGMAWQAVVEKRALISNDVQNDPRTGMKDECRQRGISSLAFLPLIVDGEGIGVLALYAAEAGFFDDEEMRLLNELAGDISIAIDRIHKAERIDYLAYYDALTGLANRSLFHERLAQQLAAAQAQERPAALVVVDIERFKVINDSLGRQGGDALLRDIAGRLLAHWAEAAQLGRLGADHFGLMLTDVQNAEEAARRTEKGLHDAFSLPFRVGATELRIAAKAGIAMFPADGADAETLFKNSEAALKKAKASADKYLFYTERMTERVAEKLSLENQLRQALEKDQFVLHYQPQVDLESRRIVALEALLRWQSPDAGLVPPMSFVPLLEETGLILPVGEWALGRAAHDLKNWLQQGILVPPIAVNVSAVQMRQRDFVEVVRNALRTVPLPGRLDLEITESTLMENLEENIAKLRAVRELGVKIAIDDFGTGYSSLAYLAKLPVESLKIDRSFVATMLDDPNTMNVVHMIISLARSMRLTVVAEGVESEEQAKMLRLLRCDEMQGYLFSKPLPAADIAVMLPKGSWASTEPVGR